jgi:hypothetical protein
VKTNPDERALLAKLERLSLNILLLIGSTPVEYEPEILRQPRVKGHHSTAGLLRAVFVGQLAVRAIRHHRSPELEDAESVNHPTWDHSIKPVAPTGRQPPVWRAGHWKRQFCGPRRADRKLIWIQPYKTHLEP